VRNGDGSPLSVLLSLVQRFLDSPLTFRVQRAGRLVQEQNLWVSGQSRGDGDALALAAGEFITAGADFGP
jgi:hypothetical protein